MSKNIKKILREVAPAIGVALGGPLGGAATSILAKALLGKETATEDEIAKYLEAASPDAWAKVRQAENEFRLKLEELNIDWFKLEVEDRKSARLLASSQGIWAPFFLTLAYNVGYFTLITLILMGKVDKEMLEVGGVKEMLGLLTVIVPGTIWYWFGSSRGSKEKTQILANGK